MIWTENEKGFVFVEFCRNSSLKRRIEVDIILMVGMCALNFKNVKAKGRNPIPYVLITIALWFGIPFCIGFIAGVIVSVSGNISSVNGQTPLTTILGIIGVALAAFISYKICKNVKSANPEIGSLLGLAPLPNAGPTVITPLYIIRTDNGSVPFDVCLNGMHIGQLMPNSTLATSTQFTHNVVLLSTGMTKKAPFCFTVMPGREASITSVNGVFIESQCINCVPISQNTTHQGIPM